MRETRDVLAEALLRNAVHRITNGGPCPSWTKVESPARDYWQSRADYILRVLAEHGLTLTRTDKETP